MNLQHIIQTIAENNGISEQEVMREMQQALSSSFTHPSNDIIRGYQKDIPCEGAVPTLEEFIQYAANRLQAQS